MIRIFVYNKQIINIDNEADAETMLALGAWEMPREQVESVFGEYANTANHENCILTETATGYDIEFIPPPKPTEEEKAAALQTQYKALIQSMLDKEAQKLGYDNCNSVCTYVDTGVQKFDDEGAAFRQWRSAVWAKGYEILDAVKAGEMAIPTEEELVEMLPKLVIAYSEAVAE